MPGYQIQFVRNGLAETTPEIIDTIFVALPSVDHAVKKARTHAVFVPVAIGFRILDSADQQVALEAIRR
jgi:hypothetical protein